MADYAMVKKALERKMDYQQFSKYTAKFTPRDDANHVLKDECRPHIGVRLELTYIGPIDGMGRPKYAGEHEFILSNNQPMEDGMAVWYSENDLSDIQATRR